jgi:hypothetical protein
MQSCPYADSIMGERPCGALMAKDIGIGDFGFPTI